MSASYEIEELIKKPNNIDKSCIKKLTKNLLEVSQGKLKNSLKKIGENLESSLEQKKDISSKKLLMQNAQMKLKKIYLFH